MKNIHIVLLLSVLSFPVFSQVSESVKTMSKGDENALSITIKEVDYKKAKELWEDYLKKFGGKVNYSRKAKEYSATGSSVTTISPGTIDIYSTVARAGEISEISAWFFLGGAYINSKDHPQQYQAAENFMNNFFVEIQKYLTGESLKQAQKTLEDQQSQYNRMVKDQKGWEKDIKDAQDKIEKCKKDIEKSKSDQAAKLTDIEKAKTDVDKFKQELSKFN